MIADLAIRNFKSIREASLECNRINVFIGEPSTGKSNLLEALAIVNMFGGGYPYSADDQEFIFRASSWRELFYWQETDRDISITFSTSDAPERGQPGYDEAKEALRSLLEGRTVYLFVDRKHVIDRYNRVVAVVFVKHNSTHVMNVNLWLVANSYARIWDLDNSFDPKTWSLYLPFLNLSGVN